MLIVFFVASCGKPEAEDTTDAVSASVKANTPGLIKIQFDAEVISFQEVQDTKAATDLQLIGAAPKASRSKIDLDVYEDGTSAWVIEKLEPKHNVKQEHLTPPDPSPQMQTTRIDRSGMGYFYDKEGNLLNQHTVPVQSFKQVVDEVKSDPKAAYGVVGAPSATRLKKLLETATRNGGTVQDMGNGLTSVRMYHGAASTGAVRTTGSGPYSVDMIDTNLNLLIGSTLYDEKDETLSKAYYSYTFEGDKAIPQAVYQELWNTEADGRKVKSITNTYYYQFSSTVNN